MFPWVSTRLGPFVSERGGTCFKSGHFERLPGYCFAQNNRVCLKKHQINADVAGRQLFPFITSCMNHCRCHFSQNLKIGNLTPLNLFPPILANTTRCNATHIVVEGHNFIKLHGQ